MMGQLFYDSDDIAQMLGVSKSKAYAIIRGMNEELKAKGMLVLHGKVSKKYFAEKLYGYEEITNG